MLAQFNALAYLMHADLISPNIELQQTNVKKCVSVYIIVILALYIIVILALYIMHNQDNYTHLYFRV